MLTIYGRTNSANVQLVMWAIAELGLEHERLDYGFGHAPVNTSDFLAKNPMGLVPVLEDGDVTIFESAAILRYIGARYGDDSFYPSDPAVRAPLDGWAEWGKNSFASAVLKIFVYDVRTPDEKKDPAVLDAATKAVTPLATILAEHLTGRDFIGGDTFSFADVACGHILHRYYTMNWERPDLPALAAYYDRLQQRAAYRDHAMVDYEALRAGY